MSLDGELVETVLRATFTVPLRTVSPLNAREHPMAKARRVKNERRVIALVFPRECREVLKDGALYYGSAAVKMTRFGPRELDDDAVPGSLKAVRDEIAKQLGLKNDNDKRVRFEACQAKGEYAVSVVLTLKPKEET